MDRSEVAERGKAIYEARIRPLVEREHFGKVVSIEINSGDYEISDGNEEYVAAIRRLRARHDHPETFSLRVGYRTLAKIEGVRRVRLNPPRCTCSRGMPSCPRGTWRTSTHPPQAQTTLRLQGAE